MTELATPGQPVADALAPQAAPETQQPNLPPATPAIPEKFAGKSVEDVARSYQELEKTYGTTAREVGELRSQLAYTQNLMQNFVAQQQEAQRQVPPPPPPPGPQFNWDKPEDSVRGVAQAEIRQAMDALRYQQAASMAEIAKSSAVRDNPQLFQGIEMAAVDQVMQQGLRQRLIAPEAVGRPETWAMAAWQIKGAQSGYGASASPNAVRPVQTEQPSNSRPQQYGPEPVQMDDALAAAVRKWGEAEGKPRDPNQLAKEIGEARAKGVRY